MVDNKKEEDKKAIQEALAELHLDTATRDEWQKQMEEAAASGWFCPQDHEEMNMAIAALREGKEVPSFPRSG